MLVRMVASEGLQPMVTEAFFKEDDNIQCGLGDIRLEELKESNHICKFLIAVIIMISIIGFVAVIFALKKFYKHVEKRCDEGCYHVEKRYWESWEHTDYRTDNAEFQITKPGNLVVTSERLITMRRCSICHTTAPGEFIAN